jgi:chaperone required for assembly of F1-ATPase
MKRFYKTATAEQTTDGFAVLLDGKPIKTPAGKMLVLPTQKLAQAIAHEWDKQGDIIVVSSMPMMQLAATTLDHVATGRAQMVDRLLAYAGTDVLCHRTPEPRRLYDMQEKLFAAPLSWLRRRYDVDLNVTLELMAVKQSDAAMQRIALAVHALNDWALMGVQTAALASGSIVLSLAMFEKEFAAEDVFEIAEVETTYQIEKWGSDDEIIRKRMEIATELNAVQKWFALLE